jgi:hypothetical protein
MTRFLQDRRRSSFRGASGRKSRPTLEGLEDRLLLFATNGGAWVYPSRITYSFVPDGTSIGGVPSNMFATLNAVASTATWELAIEKAAALWSSYSNINLAQVSDDGSALGVSGNQQGDPRFGDIRISMIPQGTGTLAYAMLPPPLNGGTAAGDIVFNSNIAWKINASYDLETVALHEFGHALGLDHSALSTAVMYAYYNGVKQSLTSDDIAGIQSIYGAYPASMGYTSVSTADNVTSLIDGNGQIALGGQHITGASDNAYYAVTVPANTTGTMTVTVQSTTLSSLAPRVGVYNGSKTLLGSIGTSSLGGSVTMIVNGVSPGQVYYIRAVGNVTPGSFGAYGLLVNFGSGSQSTIQPPNTVVAQQTDQVSTTSSDSLPVGPWGWPDQGIAKIWRHWLNGLDGGSAPPTVQLGTLKAYGDTLTPDDQSGGPLPNSGGGSLFTSADQQAGTVAWPANWTTDTAAAVVTVTVAPWTGLPTQAVDLALAQWVADPQFPGQPDPAIAKVGRGWSS